MSKEIPDKSSVKNYPDGGIKVTVGKDHPFELIQGKSFHRWGDNSYVSEPDSDGSYLVILPPGQENQAVVSMRDRNHRETKRVIYRGEEKEDQ